MTLAIGSIVAKDVRVGAAQAVAVYVGTVKVWPTGVPIVSTPWNHLTTQALDITSETVIVPSPVAGAGAPSVPANVPAYFEIALGTRKAANSATVHAPATTPYRIVVAFPDVAGWTKWAADMNAQHPGKGGEIRVTVASGFSSTYLRLWSSLTPLPAPGTLPRNTVPFEAISALWGKEIVIEVNKVLGTSTVVAIRPIGARDTTPGHQRPDLT